MIYIYIYIYTVKKKTCTKNNDCDTGFICKTDSKCGKYNYCNKVCDVCNTDSDCDKAKGFKCSKGKCIKKYQSP